MGNLVWANLLHLSYNMWSDVQTDEMASYSPDLRCDDGLWDELTERMAAAGFTMIVIDLGDGVQYESHPETAVNGAWTTDRLTRELRRLRQLGLEPIPKLNFSTCHDAWLGQYSRQVSTPLYYQVCTDLINEVSSLFNTPRFFHIGMDEENAGDQASFHLAIMRQHDLWWHDLNLLADAVSAAGSRPWVWSDHAWGAPGAYYERMPKRVVQSNWYYGTKFSGHDEANRPRKVEGHSKYLAYLDLDDQGYDQIPACSNWSTPENFELTVEFALKRLNSDRLLGFLQTPWKSTELDHRDHHIEAIDAVARVIKSQS